MIKMFSLALRLVDPRVWSANWAWGLALIVLTVVSHVAGLTWIRRRVLCLCTRVNDHQTMTFSVALGVATLLTTGLHGFEASLWDVAYRLLNALPDNRSAMPYSLNAITSYEHTNLYLEPHWQLMGAMESLNGWLLFGLTTAFLFAVIDDFRQATAKA